MEDDHVYPVKPGDWVTDFSLVGIIQDVYVIDGEPLANIKIHDRTGRNIGRESPAEGGTKKFEPAVPLKGWSRINRPAFPIEICRIPVEGEPGRYRLGYHFGHPLPARTWTRPKPRARVVAETKPNALVEALRAIADGHNDARDLARQTLADTGLIRSHA